MPATTTSSKTETASGRILPGLLMTASLLWCVYWFLHARGYWEDDAWIHLEFARSLAAGHGFSFNGHVVSGDTAPLWVCLLVAVHAAVPDWLAAGKTLAWLGALFGLGGIHAFARRVARDLLPIAAAQIFPAAMVLLVVANPYTCYWIFSGMEPVACAGLACYAVLLATRTRPSVFSFLVACLLAGLGPLVRPEMTFLAMLLSLPLLGQWRRLDASTSVRLLCAVAGLALLAGPSLVWSLYSLHAFGHLLPNTNAAKRAGPNESVLRRLITVYLTGLPVLLAGAVAGLAYFALHPIAALRSLRGAIASTLAGHPAGPGTAGPEPASKLPATAWIFVLWTLIATLFYLANHTYVQTRYVFITFPALSVIVLALGFSVWPRNKRWLYTGAMVPALALSLLLVVPLIRNKVENGRAMSQLARFMQKSVPRDAPVAVYEIGQIAFESQHPVVDTGGITRPGVIPYLNAPLQTVAEWARANGAQYYIEAHPPLPGSIQLFAVDRLYVGWTPHLSKYTEAVPVSIWKLPASAVRPANTATFAQP